MQKACTHLDPSAEPSAETTEVVLTGLTVTQRKTWQRKRVKLRGNAIHNFAGRGVRAQGDKQGELSRGWKQDCLH